jgi:hypothetical protein
MASPIPEEEADDQIKALAELLLPVAPRIAELSPDMAVVLNVVRSSPPGNPTLGLNIRPETSRFLAQAHAALDVDDYLL